MAGNSTMISLKIFKCFHPKRKDVIGEFVFKNGTDEFVNLNDDHECVNYMSDVRLQASCKYVRKQAN